ncbi:MAG: glycosyltransferase family 2 protein [Cocleimonas sp.]|nr:glycosyltransferase family 2 protein [Cocleimonas sp.]
MNQDANKPDFKQLDIIIVSYNTAEYTKRAIQSAYDETTKTSFNIIVVDNNSPDNSVEVIRDHFPDVLLIESKKNLGFAGGVNLGAKVASSEYILLLNPDTLILDGAIDKIMHFSSQKSDAGIWGGVTLNNDLTLNPNNARAKLSFKTLLFSALGLSKVFRSSCFFNHDNYGCWNRNSIREVDVITGCFFLTTRSLWQKLNGFDDTFFMYAEEADYCTRAIAIGHQPIVTPSARLVHHGGVSEANFSGKMIKLLKGKAELINKHTKPWKQPLFKKLLLMHVMNKVLSYNVLVLLKRDKKSLLMEWRTIFQQRHAWLKGYR